MIRVKFVVERAMPAPPVGAFLVKVTVQVLREMGPRLAGLQASEETCTGASRLTVVLAELPLYVAVRVALWSLPMVAVVTLKLTDVAAAATLTDAGAVRVKSVLDRVTVAPPVGAALLRVTVQVELPELFSVAGRQDREVTVGKMVAPPVTVPPVEESGWLFPRARTTHCC